MKNTIPNNLIGVRVKVRPGHGRHENTEGTVRGVYLNREDSIFGRLMLVIANDAGEMFETFAAAVTIREARQ